MSTDDRRACRPRRGTPRLASVLSLIELIYCHCGSDFLARSQLSSVLVPRRRESPQPACEAQLQMNCSGASVSRIPHWTSIPKQCWCSSRRLTLHFRCTAGGVSRPPVTRLRLRSIQQGAYAHSRHHAPRRGRTFRRWCLGPFVIGISVTLRCAANECSTRNQSLRCLGCTNLNAVCPIPTFHGSSDLAILARGSSKILRLAFKEWRSFMALEASTLQ